MDQQQIMEYVSAATLEVFSTMLGMELAPRERYVSPCAPTLKAGVLSFIGLAGPWVGTGSIACSPAFACQVATGLLMVEYPAVNEEVLDAIAEITNMVIGNVKTSLETQLGPMGLSIPTVIFGRNFLSRTSGTLEWMVVPFQIGTETVEIQLCLTPKANSDDMTLRSSQLESGRPAPMLA